MGIAPPSGPVLGNAPRSRKPSRKARPQVSEEEAEEGPPKKAMLPNLKSTPNAKGKANGKEKTKSQGKEKNPIKNRIRTNNRGPSPSNTCLNGCWSRYLKKRGSGGRRFREP